MPLQTNDIHKKHNMWYRDGSRKNKPERSKGYHGIHNGHCVNLHPDELCSELALVSLVSFYNSHTLHNASTKGKPTTLDRLCAPTGDNFVKNDITRITRISSSICTSMVVSSLPYPHEFVHFRPSLLSSFSLPKNTWGEKKQIYVTDSQGSFPVK